MTESQTQEQQSPSQKLKSARDSLQSNASPSKAFQDNSAYNLLQINDTSRFAESEFTQLSPSKNGKQMGVVLATSKEPSYREIVEQYNRHALGNPSSFQKSASLLNMNQQSESMDDVYENEGFEESDDRLQHRTKENLNDNIKNKSSIQNSHSIKQKKISGKAQRAMSKDPKIVQTMKAYFPQISAAIDPTVHGMSKKKQLVPLSTNTQHRSSTTSSQKGQKPTPHSERIIFVENQRKPPLQQTPVNGTISIDRKQMNQQMNNSITSASNKNQNIKRNTKLPPIDKRQQLGQVEIIESSSSKVLSPISNQQYDGTQDSSQNTRNQWSDKKKNPKRKEQSAPLEGEFENIEMLKQAQKTDFEKKNQDKIKEMQEKKYQEQKMMEEERRKMIKRQDKLKQMVLKQAAEVKLKRQQNEEEMKLRMAQEELDKPLKKTPKKKKPYVQGTQAINIANQNQMQSTDTIYSQNQILVQPSTGIMSTEQELENQEEKKNKDIMKKYYRSRYATFIKTLTDQNKKKEQDLDVIKEKDEKRKQKLKEEMGVVNIQSRFMDDSQLKPRENQIIDEVKKPITKKEVQQRRGSSQIAMKTYTSSSFAQAQHLKDDQTIDMQKIYQASSGKRDRSNSQSVKRALTPKIKKSKRVIVMGSDVIDEKNEEDLEKELKAKREAAEKIKMRQQKYLNEIQQKKEKELKSIEEDKKKKDYQKKIAREQAKQNFDKVNNQPGLKELQVKAEESTTEEGTPGQSSQKKKKPKVPESGLEAFLERNNPKRQNFPNITDLVTWRKKYKVDDGTKVFICTGGYPDIKRALKQRGWVHNKDATSPCFDLKWVLKSKDIDHNLLNDNQLVNHFNKAAAITTKVGLCHNLKNLIWFNNVDIDDFYPRCFDLAIQEELDDFVEEFKAIKAETYVRIFVREMRESLGEKPSSVTEKVLKLALKVNDRRLKELDEMIDDPTAFSQLVSDDEWKILGADELNQETLAQKKHEDWLSKNEVMQKEKKRKEQEAASKAKPKKKKKKIAKKPIEEQEQTEEGVEGWGGEQDGDDQEGEEQFDVEPEAEAEEESAAKVEADNDALISAKHPEFKRAVKILEELKKKYPQQIIVANSLSYRYNMNGERNIWIIKPAGSSRGRGIVLYKSLVEILDLCKQKEAQFIAQKYMENSLIVKSRKFDIRQWVLVTDWNPLTVWIYKEPYFRFPACDYDADNIMDRFIHLTNNSVAKYAEGSIVSHDIEGNMWDLDEMKSYLQEQFGWDVWEDKLKDQAKNIVINCLESVQDMFECKKGCFELFGFDLMVDEDFNMWLIEVNSSPAMDYSTKVTEKLVKMVSEDTVKVIVDYAEAKKKSKVDTGEYECIYKATRIVDKPIHSFGLNLVCEGKKIAGNKLSGY